MILGLPLDSWILILASVGIGLLIELLYLHRQRSSGGAPGREPLHSDTRPPRGDTH